MSQSVAALGSVGQAKATTGPDFSIAARQSMIDRAFYFAALFFALLVLALLGGVILSLILGSIPVFQQFGLSFIWTDMWDPVMDEFGALAPIYGTIVTSLIAMLFGVPISFGIAVFLTELCPERLRRPISTAIELLAGIPSIIYGIWGLFVLVPLMQSHVEPFLINTLGYIPGIGMLFKGPPFGIGIFTAGLILAVMILPFITSVMRDVFAGTPEILKESAYGLGSTTWEVVWNVVLPYGRTGVVGAIMLGLGRALGETMAVTFVVGNAHRISTSILQPGTTISATIANEFTEAVGDLYVGSLIALGLILFIITFFVLAASRLMLARLAKAQGS